MSFQRVSCRVPTDKVCHPSGFAPLLSKQDKMTTHLNDCRCLYIPPPSVPGHTLPLSLQLEPSDAAMSVYLLLVNPSGRLPHTCDGQGTHVNRPIDVVMSLLNHKAAVDLLHSGQGREWWEEGLWGIDMIKPVRLLSCRGN